jgi:hypothetical protein
MDNARLGTITNTTSEQKVLNELSQLIENDYSPEHKTVAELQELVRLMHRNLKHDSSIMLAMNKLGPASKNPTEFFRKFIIVRSTQRSIWYSANDLGYLKSFPKGGSSSNQSFSTRDTDSSQSNRQQKKQKRDDLYSSKLLKHGTCWSCDISGHKKEDCMKLSHPDSNKESVPFLQSTIGKIYLSQFPLKPQLSNTSLAELKLGFVPPTPYTGTGSGPPAGRGDHRSNKGKSGGRHGGSGGRGGGRVPPRRVPIIAGKSIRALLDTGCLVGDCISKSIVDSLDASHLLFNVSTTICSGFNNQCQNNFQALKINLSFLNEITSSLEHIITTVIVLKDSSIDLIIDRETIKKQSLIDLLPSHFKESTNLNVLRNAQESFADNSIKTRKVPFVDDYSEELFGYKPKNQVQSEMHRHVRVHAHTCLSCLNPDDRSVDSYGPTVNKQTDGQDSIHDTTPMCLLNNSAPHGSCLGWSDQLLPRHLSEGDQMMATMTEGENENPLL